MKQLLKSTIMLLLLIFSQNIEATTYYSSPTGNSNNSGTNANSPLDLWSGINRLVAGDVLQLAGGTYVIPFVKDEKNTIFLAKSGTAQMPITIQAANGEKATLDFSFPPQEWVQDGFGFDITGDYWYFKNINITRAGYQGVYVKGAHNTFENCAFYENRNTGLEINKGGSYTTVINCDAYRNYDPKKLGSMADGFGPKQTMGPGNQFIGCRAWENSDDGYDCFDSPQVVTFENCWAFRNGVDVWNYGGFSGNGNGFKLGGNDAIANNKTTQCIAFGHPKKGFDQNNNKGALTLLNCTAYNNGDNYGIGAATASGEKHYFRNNISIDSDPSISNADQAYNSWNAGFSVSTADFISLNTSLATIARNADGSIPDTDLFRLKPTSSLVDAGTDVGLPFEGAAPDLGAFEVVDNSNSDCNGDPNGSAYLDDCGVCVGGNTLMRACVGSLEAEEACLLDGTIDNNNAGFSGEGFANTTNAIGSAVSWVLTSNQTQTATVSFRFANGGTTTRDGALTINGSNAGTIAFPPTGAWTSWDITAVNLDLTQGTNELILTAITAEGIANIDLLSFSDGVSDASCLITASKSQLTTDLMVYPNPVHQKAYWNKDQRWEMVNVLGEEVMRGNGSEADFSNLANGVYFLKIDDTVVRIVKQ